MPCFQADHTRRRSVTASVCLTVKDTCKQTLALLWACLRCCDPKDYASVTGAPQRAKNKQSQGLAKAAMQFVNGRRFAACEALRYWSVFPAKCYMRRACDGISNGLVAFRGVYLLSTWVCCACMNSSNALPVLKFCFTKRRVSGKNRHKIANVIFRRRFLTFEFSLAYLWQIFGLAV